MNVRTKMTKFHFTLLYGKEFNFYMPTMCKIGKHYSLKLPYKNTLGTLLNGNDHSLCKAKNFNFASTA